MKISEILLEKVKTKEKTLFACRHLENADEFIDWAKSQGFESVMPKNKLHCTIMYSKEQFDWSYINPDETKIINTDKNRKIQPLGDKGAIVLRFEDEKLEKRWQFFKDCGASYDFKTYKPHISITWEETKLDLSKIEPYKGKLIFKPEHLESIDEDWKKKIKEK